MPNGQPFHRRWQVRAWHGSTAVSLEFSLGGGYHEHRIHLRGLIGSATADFDAGTYVLAGTVRFLMTSIATPLLAAKASL